MIHKIIPESKAHWHELRSRCINSTDIAALFGLSPYMTYFELFVRHSQGISIDFEETERTKWGTRLQASIAQGIAEDQGWEIREAKEYMWDDELKMGSSFDYMIQKPNSSKLFKNGEGDIAILEIKNVDSMAYKAKWLEDDDGNLEAPPFIELQVQHQMALTGLREAYVAPLIGGNKVVLIEREADDEIIESIRQKIRDFWKRIKENDPPDPDFKHDMTIINKLYGYAEAGKVIDADGDVAMLASAYKEISGQIKTLETAKDEMKARILMNIKDAEKVLGEGFSITTGIVKGSTYEVTRKPYRMFKINWKKEK